MFSNLVRKTQNNNLTPNQKLNTDFYQINSLSVNHGDKNHSKSLYFSAFDSSVISDDFFASLLDLDIDFDYSLNIKPITKSEARKLLNAQSNGLADITSALEAISSKGFNVPFSKIKENEQKEDELDELADRINTKTDTITEFSLVLSVFNTNLDQLKEQVNHVLELAKDHGLLLRNALNFQKQILDTQVGFENKLPTTLNHVATSETVTCLFQARNEDNNIDENSVYIGEKVSGQPLTIKVVGDYKEKPHILVTGETGSGKTTLVNQIIIQEIIKGTQGFSIDPQGHNCKITEVLGGENITFGKGGGFLLLDSNNLQDDDYLDETAFFLFSIAEHKISKNHLANALFDIRDDKTSDLFLVFEQIAKQNNWEKDLSPLFKSGLRDTLTYHKPFTVSDRFTNLSLHGVSDIYLPFFLRFAFLKLMQALKDSSKPKFLLMDESYQLISTLGGQEFTEKMFKSTRKQKVTVIFSDQTISQYGSLTKTIWDSCKYKFLLRQSTEDIKDLLNPSDVNQIKILEQGEGLLIQGKHQNYFNVQMLDAFKDLIEYVQPK
jgi:type IV secretory pathway VirB4 component